MIATVLCFASAKGGSGKTTLTATFATFLSELGKKVLVVDCDEATHGLTLIYLEKVQFHKSKCPGALGFFEMYYGGATAEEATMAVDESLVSIDDGLFLLPATFRFGDGRDIGGDEFKPFKSYLIHQLGLVRNRFDYIFLDAQAGADLVSQAAIQSDVSDQVIIVSEYDPMSMAGIERLKGIMGAHLSFDRTWILFNKLLPEFVQNFSKFLSVARYLPPVPWTADVVRAYANQSLAVNFEKPNQFTLAAKQTLEGFINNEDCTLLHKWIESRAFAIREPISKQIKEMEYELALLEERKQMVRRREKLTELISMGSFLFAICTALAATLVVSVGRDDVAAFLRDLPRSVSIAGAAAISAIGFGFIVRVSADMRRFRDKSQEEILEFRRKKLIETMVEMESLHSADLNVIVQRREEFKH